MSSILDWVVANSSKYSLELTQVIARGISTGGYYAMRIAHTHQTACSRLLPREAAATTCLNPAWILAQNQMECPFDLANALAYNFGYRDGNPVEAYATGGRKVSLLESGGLDRPSCRLLIIDGMEDSIFPIEDNFIFGVRGDKKELLARGNRQHMGNPGAEGIVYNWIDDVLAGKP